MNCWPRLDNHHSSAAGQASHASGVIQFPQIPAQCKVLRTCDIGPVQRLIHLASALAALDGILRHRSKQGRA
jgi:hypothetical protein